MLKSFIDINCDMGEGIGGESDLLPLVSSCNIACGGHAGDSDSMNRVVKLAKELKVKIGAHPSFPDKEHFGRIPMQMGYADLFTSLKAQMREFLSVVRDNNAQLHHIKPHGALYNLAVHDIKIANVIIEVVKSLSAPTILYAPEHSVVAKKAIKQNIKVCFEGFADRAYHNDLSLVSRSEEGSLIEDQFRVFDQVHRMISKGAVMSIEGVEVPIQVNTVCVHGDHKNAVQILKYLNEKLAENSIRIA